MTGSMKRVTVQGNNDPTSASYLPRRLSNAFFDSHQIDIVSIPQVRLGKSIYAEMSKICLGEMERFTLDDLLKPNEAAIIQPIKEHQ